MKSPCLLLAALLCATHALAQIDPSRLEPDLAPGSKSAADLLKPQPRPARPPLPPARLPLEFIQGERIAIVGNSMAERLARFGNFETLLHSRFPKLELVFRSFARPADEVAIRQRSSGYTNLDDPLYAFGPDTILCFFGFNESFAGPGGLEKYQQDYEKFLDEYARKYPRDDTGAQPRFVLISPVAFEPTGDGFLPKGETENANLKLYSEATAAVAKRRGLPLIDLFDDTAALFAQRPGLQYTINGAHQNEAGDLEIAQALDREIFGTTNPARIGSPAFEKLRAAVADKAWIHQQDHRMLNGWYVYGGRNTLDRETFPREFIKIRNMAAVRDRYVWDLAQGKPVPAQPDDSQTGELFTPPTKFGTQVAPGKEPKELVYPSPEESIKTMAVPEGFEVQLVASELDTPELAKVDQINFDNKGRLWASCMKTYPQWKPGDPRPNDALIIFDNIDPKTGKAGKHTVFYDKLICPTGFEFWNGGVLVVDEPRIVFLKDTDGDDEADLVVDVIDGWATDDTHHTINAWEYSPGGLLHMLEGVSLSTAVETPWGPLRASGIPGCYVLDPRSLKLRHFNTPGYGNPWCYVFDQWGQGIVGDGTTPQQHWDTPLSGAPFPGRKGLNAAFNGDGQRPNVGTEWIRSRQFPDDIQGDFILACVINSHGLIRYQITDDGAGFKGGRKKKSVDGKMVPDDLLQSTDMVFRPTDPQFGPDGALYFGDWNAAMIGHMQYSQRDPNRDHSHGRLYRLVYKNKPLLEPITQYGKSVPELLEQLKTYEPRTRDRARRELRDRQTAEVIAAVGEWTAKLDPRSADYEHHLLEALWVEQGHHAVNLDLLKKLLRAQMGAARAAATRVLADEWEFIPSAMELIQAQVVDDFPRTRCEALRALSFVQTLRAVETALLAVSQPRDYWIDYTLDATLNALAPIWKPALKTNAVAVNNPAGLAYLQEMERLSKPESAAEATLKRYLAMSDPKPHEKVQAYAEIAKARGVADNGKAVYRRICIACHKFGPEGIEYGPDLSQVGSRLKREEIIESILDPNAKIDPHYATTAVNTKDGQMLVGFVTSETPETVTMKVVGGLLQEVKVADIAKRETLQQSSMPEGLAQGMSSGEFLDLVEFLANNKAPAKK